MEGTSSGGKELPIDIERVNTLSSVTGGQDTHTHHVVTSLEEEVIFNNRYKLNVNIPYL